MAKGRWEKNSKLNSLIFDIVNRSIRHITTNDIQKRLLDKYNIKRSWQTVQDYLKEMELMSHIESIKVTKKTNTIHFWKVKKGGKIGTKA